MYVSHFAKQSDLLKVLDIAYDKCVLWLMLSHFLLTSKCFRCGDKFSLARSMNCKRLKFMQLLMRLSPRYIMVTCLTHGDGFGGRGGWRVGRRGWGSVEQNA